MKEGQKKRPLIYVLAIAILGGLLFMTHWGLNRSSSSTEKDQVTSYQGLQKEVMLRQEANKENAPELQSQTKIKSIIEALIITPQRPTVLDNLKAEVKARNFGEGKLSYQYQWQINGKAVEDAKGDVLPAGLARKNDRVTLTVVPSVNGLEYREFLYFVHAAIYNAAPSLVLKEETRKEGDVIEFQLKAEDPDGDKIFYALEEPLIEGMSIDKDTGKITWKATGKQKGNHRFRASATDSDGSRTTKSFEFGFNVR